MNSYRPRVAIFDAHLPTALATVRSLDRAGVPTCVYSHARWPMVRLSRHCRKFALCPDVEDPAAFLPWLREQLRRRAFDLVAPTSDLVAFYVSELQEELAPSFRRRLVQPDALRDALFKDRFSKRCLAAGFRVPRSWEPRSLDEAHELADALPYPALLKPKSHIGAGTGRGEVVRSADELRRLYQRYPIAPTWRATVERYPELAWPMIQEYVPGTLENLYSVSGLIGADGAVLALAGSRKVQQWPPTLGIGIEFRGHEEPSLLEYGERLALAVVRQGMFELELIWDERVNDWQAIDLNPRAHGFIRFDIERGNDLPRLWYADILGEASGLPTKPRNDLRWTHSVPAQCAEWVRRFRGEGPLQIEPGLRTVDVVHDARDPMPTAAFLATVLRHPKGLVRPFLEET